MSSFSERVSNTLLVASAVTIASVVVIRELRSGPTPSTERQIPAPEFRPEWNEYLSASLELGNSDAPTVLIVFNDFECGGCRLFHERVIGKLRDRGDLSIRLLHLPLRIHRFAPSAARAAECADAQGELHGLVEAIFAKQDSLGLKSWISYGEDAGLPDTGRFQECVAGNEPFERIAAGMRIAESLEVNATPTLMLNGWLFRRIPDKEQLLAAIEAVMAGKAPRVD
ncbi:MAG: thioredoxin domain-containing protein [Gemmatimonadota bacterium]|nr:thioredoxin domain-containing protein [Gemmatimonadota bacterium]